MIWLYPKRVKGVTHNLGQFQKIDHEDHFFAKNYGSTEVKRRIQRKI